jgi:hypothetical protein
MSKVTQQAKILAYCNLNGSITIREAFEKLKMNSPSKRISEMRNSPLYHVESITEYSTEGVPFKRYFIKEART